MVVFVCFCVCVYSLPKRWRVRLKILTMNDMKLDPNLFQTLIIHGEGEAIQIIVRLEKVSQKLQSSLVWIDLFGMENNNFFSSLLCSIVTVKN